MLRPRMIQLVALVCCVGLVSAAASRIGAINDRRRTLNMMGAESPLENAPPEYAFAIQAFGAFRGLITDIAFIRAEQYKEQGRFYDAMQLAKWICKLQPRFPSVWEFAAWNMAWNISVTTYTAEERWNWVYNGAKLLRDEGIPYNRRSVNLYRQLAWIFTNKMGEVVDDQHYAYKCNWAWRMHLLLGPPPDSLAAFDPAALAEQSEDEIDSDLLAEAARRTHELNEEKRRERAEARGQEFQPRPVEQPEPEVGAPGGELSTYEIAKRAVAERIRRIDEAPQNLAELYERFPATRAMVVRLRELGIVLSDDELTEDEYWHGEGLAFTFLAPYRKLTEPGSTLARIARRVPADDPQLVQAEKIDEILQVRAGDPAGQALVRFLQRKVLLEVYKLDPAHMTYIVEHFGPLDWRSVDAHSLYWVTKGLIAGGETINEFRNDKTNTARLIFFSLRGLFLRSRIIFEPDPEKIHLSYLNLSRDLNFIEPMHQAYVRYGRLFDPDPRNVQGAGDTFRVGHVNFLTEAIWLLYFSGRQAEADRYYRYLQQTYSTDARGQPNPAFAKTLRDFVMDRFFESRDNPGMREIKIVIESLLYSAYAELAAGNVSDYVRLVQRAREFHTDYNRDKTDRATEGKRLPEFVFMQADAFLTWFEQPPIVPLETIHRVRLWRNAPLYLRQSAYDRLRLRFEEECQAWGFDVARAFPEPEGMEQYRRRHPESERFKKEREGATERLPQTLGG